MEFLFTVISIFILHNKLQTLKALTKIPLQQQNPRVSKIMFNNARKNIYFPFQENVLPLLLAFYWAQVRENAIWNQKTKICTLDPLLGSEPILICYVNLCLNYNGKIRIIVQVVGCWDIYINAMFLDLRLTQSQVL